MTSGSAMTTQEEKAGGPGKTILEVAIPDGALVAQMEEGVKTAEKFGTNKRGWEIGTMKTATEARPFCASIHPDYKQRRITEMQEQLFDVL